MRAYTERATYSHKEQKRVTWRGEDREGGGMREREKRGWGGDQPMGVPARAARAAKAAPPTNAPRERSFALAVINDLQHAERMCACGWGGGEALG